VFMHFTVDCGTPYCSLWYLEKDMLRYVYIYLYVFSKSNGLEKDLLCPNNGVCLYLFSKSSSVANMRMALLPVILIHISS
jgi:hypothetical protein